MSLSWFQSVSLSMIIPVLKMVLELVTPDLRDRLKTFVLEWYQSARQTENPWDDIASSFLMAILDIPTPTDTTASDLAGRLDPSLTQ